MKFIYLSGLMVSLTIATSRRPRISSAFSFVCNSLITTPTTVQRLHILILASVMTVHPYILQQIIAYRYYYIHTGCNRYKKNTPLPLLWLWVLFVLFGFLFGLRGRFCVRVLGLKLPRLGAVFLLLISCKGLHSFAPFWACFVARLVWAFSWLSVGVMQDKKDNKKRALIVARSLCFYM